MINRFLVSVAAVALIAGAGAANAQGGMNREGGGAATQKGSEPSGMKSSQSEQKATGAAKGDRAEESGQKSKMSTENEKSGAKDMKAEGREHDKNMKAEGREGQDKNMKAEGRDHDKNMKAEGREGRDKDMKAEGREGRDNNMNAQGREGRENNMNAQGRTGERSQTTTGQAGAGAKLSSDQRTKITTVIRNEHVTPVNNVDFALTVGTRVPRDRISLRPLPAEVISIYPEWRGYEFFLVHSEIIVVDPRTGEIVDVLPA